MQLHVGHDAALCTALPTHRAAYSHDVHDHVPPVAVDGGVPETELIVVVPSVLQETKSELPPYKKYDQLPVNTLSVTLAREPLSMLHAEGKVAK